MQGAERFRVIGNFFGSVVFAVICTLIILKKLKGLARVAAVIKVRRVHVPSA